MSDSSNMPTMTAPSRDMSPTMMKDGGKEDQFPLIGHQMPRDDPDNPMNWSLHRRLYTTACAFAFTFAVGFGATAYTACIQGVIQDFDVSMTRAVLGLSLYLFGIAFAPITTPHLSELFGRATVYLISLPIFSLFVLGAGLSSTFTSLAVCRFFAGFFGGPCLALIEGTFADIWSADATVTYYSVLSLASYVGAACGPLIGGFVVPATSWRWTQWVTLMISVAAYLLGIGQSETYGRQILARRARRHGQQARLAPAQSGVTLGQMLHTTLLTPLRMIVTEPIVIGTALYLGFNFAVIFSFISIPVVLTATYGFTLQHVGLAFIAATVGALLAAGMSITMDRLTHPHLMIRNHNGKVPIEYRLYPAMVGGFLITASLFWIAWTADPKIPSPSPILGTLLYVWGNMSVLISGISYLFDAYPPRGTLSALTAVASFRLLLAAAIPLCIVQMIMGLTGAWAYSLFGFISAALIPLPWLLFRWGPKLRARSRYSPSDAVEDEGPLSKPASGLGSFVDRGSNV
ncbi:MAG: hypothetical protein M1838_005969 [Thelocarpon superellum]|nr:MAG: hypothetical protein M1838_005969 [Thelocarpon superellum]